MDIGLWICEAEQGKGYGTEVYGAMLDWVREHTIYDYLTHSLVPENI
jgi:RimJ/RimL family protein N-acetyltransferase